MEGIKNKLTTFSFWFVIFQPIIDIITSIMVRFISPQLTIGVVTRALFVVFIVVYVLFFYDNKYKNAIKVFLLLICIYGVINIIEASYYNGIGTLFENTKMFIKVFYFLFVLVYFGALYLQYRFVINDWALVVVFLVYTASIFMSAITDTSFVTYAYAEGFCGWFYAGNEVGAIVSVLAAIALYTVLESKKIAIRIIVSVLLVFAATYIGTKVPLCACIGAIVILLILYFSSAIRIKNKYYVKKCLFVGSIFILLLILFYYDSPVMNNNKVMMSVHYDDKVTEKLEDLENLYYGSSEEEHSEQLFWGEESLNIHGSVDMGDKTNVLLNWILSDRLVITKPAFEAYEEADMLQKFWGMGYGFVTPNGQYNNLIEMDFIMLIINHGLIGFTLYMIPILWFAFTCLKGFFKNIKKSFDMKKEIVYLYSILIALASAFLAGHVFSAPSVSIYVAIVVINLYAKTKNREDLKEYTAISNQGEANVK